MKADWRATAYDAMGRALTVTTKLSDGSGTRLTQSVVTNVYDGSRQRSSPRTTRRSAARTRSGSTTPAATSPSTGRWASRHDSDRRALDAHRLRRRTASVTGESEPGNAAAPGAAGSTADQLRRRRPGDAARQQPGRQLDHVCLRRRRQRDDRRRAASPGSASDAQTYDVDRPARERQTNAEQLHHRLGLRRPRPRDRRDRRRPARRRRPRYNDLGWVLRTIDANGVTTRRPTTRTARSPTRPSARRHHASRPTTPSPAASRRATDPNGNGSPTPTTPSATLHARAAPEDWNARTSKDVSTDVRLARPPDEPRARR